MVGVEEGLGEARVSEEAQHRRVTDRIRRRPHRRGPLAGHLGRFAARAEPAGGGAPARQGERRRCIEPHAGGA